MKNLLFILLAAVLFCACNPYEKSYIEMKKEPCFGFCPVYSVKIEGKDGSAVFKGDKNVKKEGNWKRTLTPEECKALFKAFDDANFWQFQDEYTAQVTDLPTIYLTFSHNGQTKTVKDYYGAPEALKNLEKLVEVIAEADEGWTKTE